MATTTDVHRRAELNLETIGLMLGDLPEISAEGGDLSSDERISWSLDWSNEMAGLDLLAGYAADGLLTEHQCGRLRDLRRKLEAAQPIIQRLGLQAPSVVVEKYEQRG